MQAKQDKQQHYQGEDETAGDLKVKAIGEVLVVLVHPNRERVASVHARVLNLALLQVPELSHVLQKVVQLLLVNLEVIKETLVHVDSCVILDLGRKATVVDDQVDVAFRGVSWELMKLNLHLDIAKLILKGLLHRIIWEDLHPSITRAVKELL